MALPLSTADQLFGQLITTVCICQEFIAVTHASTTMLCRSDPAPYDSSL
jgi:hypothetical protein